MIGGLSPSFVQRLDDQVLRFATDRCVAGVVVRMETLDGRLLYARALGRATADDEALLKESAAFRHEEIGEVLLAILIVLMAAERRLGDGGLDTPLRAFAGVLGDAALVESQSRKGVTLRHLLTHTSGLTGDAGELGPPSAAAEPPGRRYRRLTPGYPILGRLAEGVAGQSLGSLLSARVLRPLGLDATTLDDGVGPGAVTTAEDLSHLLAELATGRRLGRRGWVLRELTAWRGAKDLPGSCLAVGLGLFQAAYACGELWGRGDAAGAQMAYDPACRASLTGKLFAAPAPADWSGSLMQVVRPQPEYYFGL